MTHPFRSTAQLLAQKVAAARQPLAAVLLASVPPGVLWPQLRALPRFRASMPSVAAGRPFLPTPDVMRAVPLCTLSAAEQDRLIPEFVRDSGRVFRESMLGAPIVRVRTADVCCPVLCVSAGQDRSVAPWMSRRIAARYGAQHQIHPGLPHWIIAESALTQVAPPVLAWLRTTLALG